eukprot:3438374-Rhodomonas_salina.1
MAPGAGEGDSVAEAHDHANRQRHMQVTDHVPQYRSRDTVPHVPHKPHLLARAPAQGTLKERGCLLYTSPSPRDRG